MAIKSDELKKAIQSTSKELDKLQESLFNQMQFDHQSVIAIDSGNKTFCLKIHIGEYQLSIAFKRVNSLGYQTDEFNYHFKNPFHEIDDIAIFNRNNQNVTDSFKFKNSGKESIDLADLLNYMKRNCSK